jgi:hypothetical protein
MLPPQFHHLDAIELGIVSSDDLDDFTQIALREARHAQLVGGLSTSLEPAGTVVDYRLLDGDQISLAIPRLHGLYEREFLSMATRLAGRSLMVSPMMANGINVNVLEGVGGRYEWHVDSNPFTGLLVLSDANAEVGGRLLFGRDPLTRTALCMRAGSLLLFDARTTPHAVEELRTAEAVRLTCPMNYFFEGEQVVRPGDLDGSLYGSAT